MPRFFFHLKDGITVCDEDGLVFATPEDARQEAIKAAREIMANDVRQGRLSLRDQILIDDENGRPVMVVPFADAIEIRPQENL